MMKELISAPAYSFIQTKGDMLGKGTIRVKKKILQYKFQFDN